MLQNYSKFIKRTKEFSFESLKKYNWWMILVLPAWVFVGFFTAQAVLVGIIWLLAQINISFDTTNQVIINGLLTVIVYLITLLIVISVPWFIRKHRVNKEDIGLTRLPLWSDIAVTPAALIIYFIASSGLIIIFSKIFPWFDINQAQNTGFNNLSQRYEYTIAFVILVIVAPIAEEVLFRGYLYGRLKKYVPVWVGIVVTSIFFGFIHGAWNLAIDTFTLSVILCLLRELTGSIWASILLHMTKNGIAFYLLFISPLILTTLGK